MAQNIKQPVVDRIRQSPPVDLSIPYDGHWLRGKHMLITGGASGFGAGFVRPWAAYGASIVIGDINTQKGDQLVREIKKQTDNQNVHFVYCDVTDWPSQVNLFKEAVRLSPHGGIDTVVANAGIAGVDPLQTPQKLDTAEPPKPDFKVIDVNLYGVLYTTHLALFYLPKNPGSKACSPDTAPADNKRDRHLLLIGSVASLSPILGQPLYGASKHAVLGLFRSLRASTFVQGVRTNLLCPYFIDTPILPATGRVVLAGGATGKVEDVVDAGTRFAADTRILGRALVVGPKVKVKQQADGEWVTAEDGEARAVWEAYVDDFEDSELFTRRMVGILNAVESARGWAGWAGDVVNAAVYGLKSLWR